MTNFACKCACKYACKYACKCTDVKEEKCWEDADVAGETEWDLDSDCHCSRLVVAHVVLKRFWLYVGLTSWSVILSEYDIYIPCRRNALKANALWCIKIVCPIPWEWVFMTSLFSLLYMFMALYLNIISSLDDAYLSEESVQQLSCNFDTFCVSVCSLSWFTLFCCNSLCGSWCFRWTGIVPMIRLRRWKKCRDSILKQRRGKIEEWNVKVWCMSWKKSIKEIEKLHFFPSLFDSILPSTLNAFPVQIEVESYLPERNS